MTNNKLSFIKHTATAIVILGIIHLAATPVILQEFTTLTPDQLSVFLYMFCCTGLAVILTGLVIRLQISGLAEKSPAAWTVSLLSGGFFLIIGCGAVIAMRDNSFAYITLILSIILMFALYRFNQSENSKN